ncbi:hypothetical protein [Nocardia sp. XZ_19_385]|uniref:hypothetical protein n=1 Tax=Nocardia sp. XZ_19_385 TaxID=2769488 RepID=UPI0018906E58|nr:hypothetical protein [Nocardia sp. XZ_19_385]
MNQAFRTPHRVATASATGLQTRQPAADAVGDRCGVEPGSLTYRRAREILYVHEVHGPACRQWLAAAAYLSAGLDDE